LNTAAGVGKLFTIEQAAARTNDPVAEVTARAEKDLSMSQWMRQGQDFLRRGHGTLRKIENRELEVVSQVPEALLQCSNNLHWFPKLI
jgi:hypothetical protein